MPELDLSIVSLFKQTGFSEKEARVYAALLLLGESDATSIAKKAGVLRTNVYPIAERLMTKGYVSESGRGKTRKFIPAEPSKIFHQMETGTKLFREMLPFLSAYTAKGGDKPKIQYYEGKDAVTSVFRDINLYPEAFFISSIKRLQAVFPEDVSSWRKVYTSNLFKVTARALHTNTEEDTAFISGLKKERYTAKFLPVGSDIKMDFSIYGNNIAISSLTREPFIVVIQSEDLVFSMKSLFELLWQASVPAK